MQRISYYRCFYSSKWTMAGVIMPPTNAFWMLHIQVSNLNCSRSNLLCRAQYDHAPVQVTFHGGKPMQPCSHRIPTSIRRLHPNLRQRHHLQSHKQQNKRKLRPYRNASRKCPPSHLERLRRILHQQHAARVPLPR